MLTITSTQEGLAELAGRIGARTIPISGELTEQPLRSIDELRNDEFAHDRFLASTNSHVTTFTHLLRHPADLEAVDVPLAAVQFVHWVAQRGVPLTALTRAYYLAAARVSTICMFELVQIIDRRDELAAALEQVNIVVHGYADRVCERITKLYYAERERWLREQGTERLDMLRALVGGQHMDLREVESTLGYGLGGEHLGIVAWDAAGNPM
jgi:hypothetical protein